MQAACQLGSGDCVTKLLANSHVSEVPLIICRTALFKITIDCNLKKGLELLKIGLCGF